MKHEPICENMHTRLSVQFGLQGVKRSAVKMCTYSSFSYSQTCVKRPLSKRPKIDFQDQLSLNAAQKYSEILLTFIKLPFVIRSLLSIFEWPFYTRFTVHTVLEFDV